MKRRRMLFLAAFALVFICGLAVGAGASGSSQKITASLEYGLRVQYNDQIQTLTDANGQRVYPIVYNNTTYLPIRSIGNMLGVKIDWDQSSYTALLGENTTLPPAIPTWPPDTLATYYNDTVFIGDSIMEGVYRYVAAQRRYRPTLGNAAFLTSEYGVNITTLAQNGSGYRYQGMDQTLAQILPQLPCKRVFLQLGLNDLEAADPVLENIINYYKDLIYQIKGMVPGAEVIVMTNTPKISSPWLPDYTINRSFNNDLITTFVGAVINMCETEGIPYVDVSSGLKDANGYLRQRYCSDGFLHLTNEGSAVVVNALERYAKEVLQ